MTPMRRMAQHAAAGKLALQSCVDCATTQYPPRELCVACLADRLEWRVTDAEYGEMLASTLLYHSHEPAFRDVLPLHIGLVRLDLGPVVVCFLAEKFDANTRVRVSASTDTLGRAVLTATATPAEVPPHAAAVVPSR
jgi:uncharacterized OB-fold protein